uniref:Uncharacterized protein n=1 Tax=Rhizophora mucronata TaxID=61149 RepID=A0A2P2PDA4_RHIMU
MYIHNYLFFLSRLHLNRIIIWEWPFCSRNFKERLINGTDNLK